MDLKLYLFKESKCKADNFSRDWELKTFKIEIEKTEVNNSVSRFKSRFACEKTIIELES